MNRPRVHLRPHALRPRFVEGELAGVEVDGELLPFPGLGLETELGVVVPGAGGRVVDELEQLLRARPGVRADAPDSRGTSLEAHRNFHDFGSSYQEGDHLELNTWLHRSATGARKNLEAALEGGQDFVRQSGSRVLLHATGGDGQRNTWSSLHTNVPISDRTYRYFLRDQRAGRLAYDYYLPAQITLGVVDGNGAVGPDGFRLGDRTDAFDRVFGAGTMRPSRAMIVDRAEGFGCARIMNMLRALSFGPASTAGLCATQIDCLIMQLGIHGILEIPELEGGDPIRLGRRFSEHAHRKDAARIQSVANAIRTSVMDRLMRQLGEELAERLVPDWARHLRLIDEVLAAVLADDDAALVRACDWARKHALLTQYVSTRGRSWGAAHAELLEINVHYARLDARALRHRFPETRLPDGDVDVAPDDTSSWFLHWLVQKSAEPAWADELENVTLGWSGLSSITRTWLPPRGGYWPWVERREREIELVPWSFTRATHGASLSGASGLDDLFTAFGRERRDFGDYAGRRQSATR